MPGLTTLNVLMYSAQLGVVVAVGVAVPRLVGLHRAAWHYAYLRVLLLACVLLPLCQPLAPAGVLPSFSTSASATAGNSLRAARAHTPPSNDERGPLADPWRAFGAVLVIGGAARLGWLALGLASLGALRRRSMAADPLMPAYVKALGLVEASADLRVSPAVSRPVTFGIVRPVVLLPPTFDELAVDEQVGVITHELLHVRRRDWMHVLLEELVRVLFWFHPIVWWLLNRISIAREQVVDRRVVALTGTRRAYLDALLKVARAEHAGPRLPAAAMLRESQLRQRVHLLLEEVVMSRKRLLWSVVVTGALLAGSGILVVQAFPLTPQVPAPSAVPSQAATPGPVQPVVGTQPVTQPWGAAAEQAKRAPQVLQRVTPETVDVTPEPYVVVQAEIGADGHITTASAVAGEPTLFGEAADAVRQWTFEPTGEPQQMMIGLNLSAGAWEGANAAAPSLRVGGAIKPPQKTKHFPPEYPPEAKEAGVQGIVILEAVIGPTGQVREAHVLRSVPGLDAAALASVLRWGFTPTLLNGAPVPVIMTVTINFTLQ